MFNGDDHFVLLIYPIKQEKTQFVSFLLKKDILHKSGPRFCGGRK